MLGDLSVELMTQGYDVHYRDPALTPAMASANIDQAFIDQAKQLWQAINDDDLIADWFARFMTATKYPELEEMTEKRHHSWASLFQR